MTEETQIEERNPLRDGAISDAIFDCIQAGVPPSYGNVAERCAPLPNFGTLDDDEYQEILARVNSMAVQHGHTEIAAETEPSLRHEWAPGTVSAPVELPVIAYKKRGDKYVPITIDDDGNEVEGEPVEDPRVSAPTMTQEQAQARHVELNQKLAQARADVVTLQTKLRFAMTDAASAITNWQANFPKMDFSTLVREHIASENKRRADRAAGLIPPREQPKVGNTYFDKVGSYGSGDANQFVRKRMQTGGARGAYPANMRGRQIKPPSER